jgi:hypothetical protein
MNEIHLTPSKESYQWIGNDGGHKVGKLLTIRSGMSKYTPIEWLMWQSQGNVLAWVRADVITPYPSEPIENP